MEDIERIKGVASALHASVGKLHLYLYFKEEIPELNVERIKRETERIRGLTETLKTEVNAV